MNTQKIYTLEYIESHNIHTEMMGIYTTALNAELEIPESHVEETNENARHGIFENYYVVTTYHLAGNQFVMVEERRYIERAAGDHDDYDAELKDYDLWNS